MSNIEFLNKFCCILSVGKEDKIFTVRIPFRFSESVIISDYIIDELGIPGSSQEYYFDIEVKDIWDNVPEGSLVDYFTNYLKARNEGDLFPCIDAKCGYYDHAYDGMDDVNVKARKIVAKRVYDNELVTNEVCENLLLNSIEQLERLKTKVIIWHCCSHVVEEILNL